MSRHFHILTVLGCTLTSGLLCGTSNARAESLEDALAGALATHPSVVQAIAEEDASHQDVRAERSNYFPKVSANTAVGRVYGDNSTSRGLSVTRGAGYSGLWEGTVSVNQMLFDGLKTSRLLGAAKGRAESSQAALEDAQNAAALQTTLAYLNVLRVRESLAVLNDYEQKLEGYIGKINAMVESGAADTAELEQARSLHLDLKGLIADIQGQARSSDIEYQKVTGHFPDKDMTRPRDVSDLYPATLDEALATAQQSHPQITRATKEIEALEKSRDAQISTFYPSASAEISSYNKDVSDVIGGEVTDNRALVRVNWALSSGGAEMANLAKAKANLAQGHAKQTEIDRNVEATLRLAYSDLTTTGAQKNIAAEQLASKTDLLAAHTTQFEGGKVRILQLLQTESQLLSTRITFINDDYRELAAQYSVVGSLGILPRIVHQSSSPPSAPDPTP